MPRIHPEQNGELPEEALYRALGVLTKRKSEWEANVPYVASLLSSESVKIRAKALWLLGEMGLAYPLSIRAHIAAIASFCESETPLLRARAVNALGRIGRGCFETVALYWAGLFRFARDADAKVRFSFIWASENIAANTPDPYRTYMPVFAGLLRDADVKVRMEAPEFFRVIGKRRPAFAQPYAEQLRHIAETDGDRVVRIHCLAAIKAIEPE